MDYIRFELMNELDKLVSEYIHILNDVRGLEQILSSFFSLTLG